MSDTSQNTFGPPPAVTGHLPPYVAPFRSPRGLATALTALFSLTVGVDLLAAAFDANVWRLMDEMLGGGSVEDADLTRADALQAVAGVLQVAVLVATSVVFVIWFYRVRRNADFFALDSCEMKSGWAIGAWFVPIANLWLPRKVAGEVWDASTDWDSEARRPSPTLMNVWWALFVATWLVGRVATSAYEDAAGVEEMKRAAGMMMLSDTLDAVAALFALLFVRKLTRMQLDKATARQEQILPQPQP
ncbi:DUF4328 domain-containing protein [Streptomyces sp. M2CJ-2]|uniref:DUF4328 domain-containing protein n=1 Tax=Streptomyces sp. M2CJ-2 TaxID=2803948 RepID=UPI0019273C72|nr:DUF4328 domain-containing protein [Streptomyces sp. M2CJ-2]MBL3667427.1 DUF4328 domain-containing protein [Streptomyces sp. M2CJ-2]